MRLEGWKGRMRAEKRARNAFTSIIRVEFEDKRKRANRANRPGPIITVISMKTSLSGLTGSYRGEGEGRERIIGRERIRFSKLWVVKPWLNGKWSNECRYTSIRLSLCTCHHPARTNILRVTWPRIRCEILSKIFLYRSWIFVQVRWDCEETMDREVPEVDDDKIWIISYHDETPSIIVLSLLRGQNSMVTFKGGGKKKREKKLIFQTFIRRFSLPR